MEDGVFSEGGETGVEDRRRLFDSTDQRSLWLRIFWNNLSRTVDREMGRCEAKREGSELGFDIGNSMTIFYKNR